MTGSDLQPAEMTTLMMVKLNTKISELASDSLILLYLNGYIDRVDTEWFVTDVGKDVLLHDEIR